MFSLTYADYFRTMKLAKAMSQHSWPGQQASATARTEAREPWDAYITVRGTLPRNSRSPYLRSAMPRSMRCWPYNRYKDLISEVEALRERTDW